MSRRVVAVLVSAALVLTGLTVTSVVTTTAATATASSMVGQVNAARASKGLSPYRWNAHLAAVAKKQALRMARRTKLYHNPNLAAEVGSFRRVGENVGYGPTSSAIQAAFMKSPGHRANILRDYTQIGIAQVRDSRGVLWVAQVFRKPTAAALKAQKKVTAVKKTAAVTPATPAKKAVAPKRAAAPKPAAAVKQRAAAATAPDARANPVVTWEVLSRVVGVGQLVAAASGSLVSPVVQDE